MNTPARSRRALAHAILHLYPARWRDRYAPEVLDTIDRQGITWRDLADLVRCGIEEWSRGDDRRPGRTMLRRVAVASGVGYLGAMALFLASDAAFLTAVAIVRAMLGLGFSLPGGAGRFVDMSFPLGVAVWFAYSAACAVPVMAVCSMTGVARYSRQSAKVLTALSFAAFTGWLPILGSVPPHAVQVAIALGVGWTTAAIVFPASSGAGRAPQGAA
jgi:hypothetical protein